MKSFKLNRIEITANAIVLIVLIAGMILSFVDLDFFEKKFAVEDGVIEYSTALLLLFSCVLCLKRIFTNPRGIIKSTLTTALLAVVFLFGAGEEISWGQRIFNIESNEFFEENNAQKELNLHNLQIGETKLNRLIFGQLLTIFLFIYLIILPFLNRKNKSISKLIRSFAVPLPKIHHTVMFVFATLVMLIMDSSKQWEIYEFAFGMIFFLILLYPDNPEIYESKEDSV